MHNKHHSHHHHRHSDYTSSERFEDRWDHEDYRNRQSYKASRRARLSSIISLFLSVIGALILFLAWIISDAAQTVMNPYFAWGAILFVAMAFPFWFYAAVVQLIYREAGIGKRILVCLVCISSVLIYQGRKILYRYGRGTPAQRGETENREEMEENRERGEPAGQKQTVKVDTSIFKPGWYGEANEGDISLVCVSYLPNALEARNFNKRIKGEVCYATLSIINLGRQPFEISSLSISLNLKSGEHVGTLPLAELLVSDPVRNRELIQSLRMPRILNPGGMYSPIPICMPADFDWAKVESVTFKGGTGTILIHGKMLTAKEKELVMMRRDDSENQKKPVTRSPEKKPESAVDYYNNL